MADSGARAMLAALESGQVDLHALRDRATTRGGLGSSALRRLAWPRLMGTFPPPASDTVSRIDDARNNRSLRQRQPRNSTSTSEFAASEEDDASDGVQENVSGNKAPHTYYRQVELDIARSLWQYPKGIKMTQRKVLRKHLSGIIHDILIEYPNIHYYQGLHDVFAVVMLVCGPATGGRICKRLVRCHLRDFVSRTDMDVVLAQLDLVFVLIRLQDQELSQFLHSMELGPHFAVSWVLTWFAHSIDDLDALERIFDVCFVSHPWMVLYLAAAAVLLNRNKVMSASTDPGIVYKTLCDIPKTIHVEDMVGLGLALRQEYNPESLIQHRSLSKKSRTLLSQSETLGSYQAFLDSVIKASEKRCVEEKDDKFDDYPLSSDRRFGPTLLLLGSYVLGAVIWAALLTLDAGPEF